MDIDKAAHLLNEMLLDVSEVTMVGVAKHKKGNRIVVYHHRLLPHDALRHLSLSRVENGFWFRGHRVEFRRTQAFFHA